MSKIDHQALREAAERATPAMERLLMLPVDDDLLSEQELKDYGVDIDALNAFKFLTGPETVLALLDENIQLQRGKDAIEAVALVLRDDMRQAREQLAAAEKRNSEQREYYEGVIADGGKRIAELEAKLETADKLQDSAFRDGLKAGFSYGQTDDQSGFAQCMSAYSTRAGIGVKQQEDSVDSDVGRNQPGMVVAVHICAGDFVKVKGQVFEVEETDFDDHDVTLWFVGGNALKCEAGCQVEVVSAPVASGIKVKGSEHDRSTKR
ncbi:ead/Ea22-like family protein [Salmonella enterica]|uniref:Ead/Ea22-like family protein n=1 Tax=Salmonella hadar TaxID=149385 RepID=A0A730BM14_SALHA|nr:ead/Ea22-like family protein [Salmonella enterica]ECD1611435.1 ead/Ea22-like family protein [Salmonella enterica subsp. enterica serovar Hadar]EAB1934780.1 ead/Ea22-like family protein [Salmonella enterica]EAM9567508.1 ead/Ea22-like family protein [Salmonella enterica]EAP8253023.1 ead/Ea22-like family protein [Salmonella enterica]EAQ8800894.1 ead/Ea22-like family protein [Salmonella enterica]